MTKPGRSATKNAAAFVASHRPAADGELFGITELSREFGISLRAIRFYEVGMSLAEIEHILSLYGDHGEGHAKQLEYLIARIDQAMAELDTRRRNIETMSAELDLVRGELRRELAAKRRSGKKTDKSA